MLKSVLISNAATFTGETRSFGELNKINFVYGSNGCGKTTIGRIIDSPERYPSCTVAWEGDLRLKAFVYNRDFVKENFNQTDGIKGVFTLGSDNAAIRRAIEEKQEQIDKCEEAIKKAKENLDGKDGESGKRKELKDQEDAIATYCWNQIRKAYGDVFQKAFEGSLKSKSKFSANILGRFTPVAAPHRDKDELMKEAAIVFKDDVALHDAYDVPDYDSLMLHLKSDIYSQVIVGGKDVDIADMISKLGNSDWVRQGRELLPESNGKCPFCQQALPVGFAGKLNRYFDEAFIANTERLENDSEECKRLLSDLDTFVNNMLEMPDDGFLDHDAFRIAKQSLDTKISLINKCIEEKTKEPSRSIHMPSVDEEMGAILSIIKDANDKVKKHNSLVKNLAESKKKLIDDIWTFLVEENREALSGMLVGKEHLIKAVVGLEKSIKQQMDIKADLVGKITILQKKLTSVLPTIADINKLLDSYGFTSFRLAPAEASSYKLQRLDGTDVGDTLSEGEKTFVTFLYFYHLLKGGTNRETLSENRIAVIDDPVSSLDTNILFVVSSLILECINNVCRGEGRLKQLIVLTHNVYFFKEITFNPKGEHGRESERAYWIVRKDHNVSNIRRENENPIKTSYELLWREIREPNISSVGLQNAMRRIIEYYFKFLGGISQEKIEEKFVGNDRIICRSLFSWVNDGSHSIDDDLNYQVVDTEIEAYKNIFRRIFVDNGHGAHYDMMMHQDACEQVQD